jgi:hypothetical protein
LVNSRLVNREVVVCAPKDEAEIIAGRIITRRRLFRVACC